MKLILFSFIAAITIALVFVPPAESNIPPTPAFSMVRINGQEIVAENYNDQLNIVTQGDLDMTKSGNTITIKISQNTCPASQAVTGIDSSGNLVCSVP